MIKDVDWEVVIGFGNMGLTGDLNVRSFVNRDGGKSLIGIHFRENGRKGIGGSMNRQSFCCKGK